MEPESEIFYYICGVFSEARNAELQRRGWLISSVKLHAVMMLAGIVGLFVYTHSSIVGALAEVPRATPCPKVGNETTCSCDVQEGRTGEKLFSAALSREANALEVDCQRDLICAPKGLEKSTVCSAEASNWTACDLDLNKLLANNTAQVTWTECAKKDKIAEGQCKTLSIPRENFPYADEQFTVGCTQGEITKCKVTVSVTARPSVTEGDTVTCAYGASSNPSHQAVTLSPSKNSFTLVCGEKGTVLPTNYQTSFCSPGSEDAKKSCEGDYQTILPGYEGNWWHSDSNANTFTLSIPADKFPTEEAKIMVGCHQKQQLSAEQKSAQGASSPTVCNVVVTIEASSFAVSPVERSWTCWLWAAGAVALAHSA